MSRKDVPILIPGTCEFLILCDKRDFENVIMLKTLRWKIILDYLSESNVITRVRMRGKQEDWSEGM